MCDESSSFLRSPIENINELNYCRFGEKQDVYY